jgi:hypothetical protein
MSTYVSGDAVFGGKIGNFFAKIDPTSSKIGGVITRGVLSAAGTLVGIPPTLSFGGMTAVGKITGGIKSVKKVQSQNIQAGAQSGVPMVSTSASPTGGMMAYIGGGAGPTVGVSNTAMLAMAGGVVLLFVIFALQK